jgi:hypothetical protein
MNDAEQAEQAERINAPPTIDILIDAVRVEVALRDHFILQKRPSAVQISVDRMRGILEIIDSML